MSPYTVIQNRDGFIAHKSMHETIDSAIVTAAKLAQVTPRAIRYRIKAWAHPGFSYQVAGREVDENIGVWIEWDD